MNGNFTTSESGGPLLKGYKASEFIEAANKLNANPLATRKLEEELELKNPGLTFHWNGIAMEIGGSLYTIHGSRKNAQPERSNQ
jgi:hypothetical protein